MSFKKKIPSSEAEQKSETESATIPKTSPNSEVRPTTVSGIFFDQSWWDFHRESLSELFQTGVIHSYNRNIDLKKD